MRPGRVLWQAASNVPSSRHSKRHAAPAALHKAGAQLEAIVSVDPSPSWGPGQKGRVSLLAVGPCSPAPDQRVIMLIPRRRGYRRTTEPLPISLAPPVLRCILAPTPHSSPSLPTVKMVCEMFLGDAKVLKWLLVAHFKGAFTGPAMEQLA